MHNADADDGSQPIIKAIWLDGYAPLQPGLDLHQRQEELLCCLQINHAVEPIVFLKKPDDSFVNTTYEDQHKWAKIYRPIVDGNEMEDQECLGSTLGIFFMDALINPEQMQPIKRQLFEEEEDY